MHDQQFSSEREYLGRMEFAEFLESRGEWGKARTLWWELAKNQHVAFAQYRIGVDHLRGNNRCPVDVARGLKYLKLAGLQGHAESNYERGRWLVEHMKIESGLKSLQKAAQQRHVQAIWLHVEVTQRRGGAERSLETEFQMLVRACDLTEGREKEKETHKEALERASAAEYAEFQYALGVKFRQYAERKMLGHGEGRKKKSGQEKTGKAKQGNVQMEHVVWEQDEFMKKARQWLEIAKDNHFREAETELNRLPRKGEPDQ
jgi:TPR repeat protein